MEIYMFASAMLGYSVLFSSRRKVGALMGKATQLPESEHVLPDVGADVVDMNGGFASEAISEGALCRIIEKICSQQSNPKFAADAFGAFLQKHPEKCSISDINDALDYLGQRLDYNLMDLILDMLPALGLK
jgi:hypothetical protein